jgi:hypothetical protein
LDALDQANLAAFVHTNGTDLSLTLPVVRYAVGNVSGALLSTSFSGIESGYTTSALVDETAYRVAMSAADTTGNVGVGVYVVPSILLAFHYGAFDDVYGDGTIETAAANGRVYEDTPTGTYSWGTLNSAPTTTGGQTTYLWTPKSAMTANVLMVAGGGGGGGVNGGGGGAGGVVYTENVTLSGTKTISVGNGGTGGTAIYSNDAVGIKGYNTLMTGLYDAIGGGGGGGDTTTSSQSGGSGGGDGWRSTGSRNGTSGQGYAGGNENQVDPYPGGGGGGAGGPGSNGSGTKGGDGGLGVDYSAIFGTTYGDLGWFASGGGGSVRGTQYDAGTAYPGGGSAGRNSSSSPPSNPGKPHTGGGGGGGIWYFGMSGALNGESGGSGIVLIADIAYVP